MTPSQRLPCEKFQGQQQQEVNLSPYNKVGQVQRDIDSSHSRDISVKDIICYEFTHDNILFDGSLTKRSDKHISITELGKIYKSVNLELKAIFKDGQWLILCQPSEYHIGKPISNIYFTVSLKTP